MTDRNDTVKAKFIEANKPKARQICIGVPSGDEVKANFSLAFAAMTYYCGLVNIPLALCNQKGSILPANRNRLVKEAKSLNCTHLLQIDSDLTFPPFSLHRLLSHKKDIIGATYPRRSLPHDNLATPLNQQPVQNAKGLTAVDRMPTGLLLIDMTVFEKIKMPYFRFPTQEECEAYPEGNIAGEDYYLCDAARAAGFDVFLDVELSFQLTHWGEAGWRLKETSENPDDKRYEMVELQPSVQMVPATASG